MSLAGPIAHATYELEAEHRCTLSKVIPLLEGIRLSLREVHTAFKVRLLEKLDLQFKDYLDPSRDSFDPTLVAATALDPSAVLSLSDEQLAAADQFIRDSISPLGTSPDVPLPPMSHEERNSPRAQVLYSIKKKQQEAARRADTDTEYDRYKHANHSLRFDADLLAFWSLRVPAYPHLAYFAMDLHSIPATSAGIERVFSVAGNILGLRRTLLADTGLDEAVKIKCNARFLFP